MFLVDLKADEPMVRVTNRPTYHFEKVFYAHGSCHLFPLSLGFSFALNVDVSILRTHVLEVFVGTGIVVLSVFCDLTSSFPFVASYTAAGSRDVSGSVSGTVVGGHGLGAVAVTSCSSISSEDGTVDEESCTFFYSLSWIR